MKFDFELKINDKKTIYINITKEVFAPFDNKIAYGTHVLCAVDGRIPQVLPAKVLGIDDKGYLWFKDIEGPNADPEPWCYDENPTSLNELLKDVVIIGSPDSLRNVAIKYIKNHQRELITQIENGYDWRKNVPHNFYSTVCETLKDNGISPWNAPELFKILRPRLDKEEHNSKLDQLESNAKVLKKDLKNVYRELTKIQLLMFQQNEQIFEKSTTAEIEEHRYSKRVKKN